MSAECARAAAWSLPSKRSGPRPFAARTWFIADRIRPSEVRENWAAEPLETTASATKTAAQSAATCVGERIGRHFEGPVGRSASPRWGMRGPKLPQKANFVGVEWGPTGLLLREVEGIRATLRAAERRRSRTTKARLVARCDGAFCDKHVE